VFNNHDEIPHSPGGHYHRWIFYFFVAGGMLDLGDVSASFLLAEFKHIFLQSGK
jgi:hypothetical protein